ncbi:EamA family transporter [Actinomyces oris]|uniref:EamA family transporter n=1 Tax=Actinomyces oris TaxID=544580 RepID=UPI000949D02C|nr:EamA family transporter [Actinomyces oris]OLL11614.1 EamA family transporter [Actinomyces oris]
MTTHAGPSQASCDSRSAASGGGLSGGRSRIAWITLISLAPAVWGTTYIVTTHALPPGHPIFAALMRTLPVGVLALLASRQLPRGTWWWKSIVLGALNMACFFPLLFVAAQRLPGGVAATLGAAQPIIVAGLAVVVLSEHPSVWRLIWGGIGVVGVALVVLGPQAGLDALGVAAGLGGAVSMGLGVVLTKRWGRPDGVSALSLAGWQLTGAGLLLIVPALVIDGVPAGIDATAVAGYSWLGLVGGLAAYVVWFEGIRRLPVTPTALLGLLSPLTAALLGHLVIGEVLTSIQLLGFALALTAMTAGQLAPPSSRSSSRKDHS